MTNTDLYESIFKRKSVRKYDMTPLPRQTIDEIMYFAEHVKVLDPEVRYKLVLITQNDLSVAQQSIKAPHYLCLFSEAKGSFLLNAGFVLQQIDLYLSSRGFGSCWLGLAKPSRKVPLPEEGMQYVIMLCFGNTGEQVHRSDTASFNRKKMSDISKIPGADKRLEPGRLAPSASNSQPWIFFGTPQDLLVAREKPFLKSPSFEQLNLIDLGIAMCHLWLSLDHEGKDAEFSVSPQPVPDGYECLARVTARARP